MISILLLLAHQGASSSPTPTIYVGSQPAKPEFFELLMNGQADGKVSAIRQVDLPNGRLIYVSTDRVLVSLERRLAVWTNAKSALDKENWLDLKSLPKDSADTVVRTLSTHLGIEGLDGTKDRIKVGCSFTLTLSKPEKGTLHIPADFGSDTKPNSNISRRSTPTTNPTDQPMLYGDVIASRYYSYGTQPIKPADRRKAISEAVQKFEEILDGLRTEVNLAMIDLSKQIAKNSGFESLIERSGEPTNITGLKGKERDLILEYLNANRKQLGLGEESDLERLLSRADAFSLQPAISLMVPFGTGGGIFTIPFTAKRALP